MSYAKILKPRKEVIKGDGIQGIIDLENLRNKKKKTLETSPKEFFDLTYPTGDIRYMLEKLHNRFNSGEATEGLFLLEGLKGSGKSHLELLIYHLLTSQEEGNQWLERHNITCKLPDDIIVSINKFTDFPYDSIWEIVFEKLNALDLLEDDKQPNLDLLRKALGDKRIVLIFDELEVGYGTLNKKNQLRNQSFLQMLSEEALRSTNSSITIFASVYNSNEEPGATLKRVPRVEIKFSESQDRKMVVLHRLFSNYLSHDETQVEMVVQSYTNQWKKNDVQIDEKYIEMFCQSYPFTPEVIDMLFNKVLVKNFQGNRGPISLLGRIVHNTYIESDIISLADFDFSDKRIRNYLLDLDTNQSRLQCTENDYRDLQYVKTAKEILSACLTATLCSSGKNIGLKEVELARQMIKPGDNINDYNSLLLILEKRGAYFHHTEDYYFIDPQEKPYAKVENRSLRIDTNDALNYALITWKESIFGKEDIAIYKELAQVKNDLKNMDKNSPRYVLSPKQLSKDERANLYNGLEYQNLVLLLEPKSETFNAFDDHDLIKWAQLSLAARELKSSSSDQDRKRQYERIEIEQTEYIKKYFSSKGIVYILIQKENGQLEFEMESIGKANSKEQIEKSIVHELFPVQRVEEHLSAQLNYLKEKENNWIINSTIMDLRIIYKKTLGFPVLLKQNTLIDAIKRLCDSKTIGLVHPSGKKYCGTDIRFFGNEWEDVAITEPFVDEGDEKNDMSGFSGEPQGTLPTVSPEDKSIPSDTEDIYVEQLNLYTTNVSSLSELRQDIALKLNEHEGAQIISVRFTIYLEKNTIEIGALPASLRGAISGQGDLSFELNIAKTGNFNKSQVEQIAEQLPVFQDALYKAILKGYIKNKENIDEK